MPVLERGDARIHYTLSGRADGPPALLLAPGGMRSAAALWARVSWNPLVELADDYRLIAMDQRNAGASTAPVSAGDGWRSYTADQLALMDHLGIDRFLVVGMCIGGPFITGLIQAAPERVAAAVAFQPIGLAGNRQAFLDLFDAWAADLADAHPEADAAVWAAYRRAMFGGDFMFNTSRAQAAACAAPLMVLQGGDRYHPAAISRELASLVPGAALVERWKDPRDHPAATAAVLDFLARHAPT